MELMSDDVLNGDNNNVDHMTSSMLIKIGSSCIIHDKAKSSAVVPLTRIVRLDNDILFMNSEMVDSLVLYAFVNGVVGLMVDEVVAMVDRAAVGIIVGDIVGVSVGMVVDGLVGVDVVVTGNNMLEFFGDVH